MNEKELKKKLSVLKSASVPKGYWENYWPRLLERIERMSGRAEERAPASYFPFRLMIPAFAAIALGLAGYWMGRSNTVFPVLQSSSSPVLLVSGSGESNAQRVFKEMLALFPSRVNWISFVEGKVDFSISSAAYPDSKALLPLVITLPRAKEAFEARFLIRPGQSANAPGPWDKETSALIQISVTPDGKNAHITCRLNGTSGIDTDVDIRKEGTQPLGSFRWGERLIQVQLTRPSAKNHEPSSRKKSI
jgi:hypothetical protein